MTWFIGQSILFIAAAFLLGILVGWLIWGRIPRREPANTGTGQRPELAPTEPETAAQPSPESAFAAEPEPAEGEPETEPQPVALETEPTPQPAHEPQPVAPEPEPVALETESEPAPEPTTVPATLGDAEREPALVGAAAPAGSADLAVSDLATVHAEAATTHAQAIAPEIEQVADDLERIEGIGPKMAGALLKAGIRTYAHLAATDEGTLRQAIESEGLRFAPSLVTWGRQARLLADGDEAGFEELTRRLVAGRDEGRE